MASRVRLSQAAKDFLEDLSAREVSEARELALLLLSLEQNAEPASSRDLHPSLTNAHRGEKIWERSPWIIVFRVTPEKEIVEIGMIEQKLTRSAGDNQETPESK